MDDGPADKSKYHILAHSPTKVNVAHGLLAMGIFLQVDYNWVCPIAHGFQDYPPRGPDSLLVETVK
jgi:hypothetical protein